MVEVVRTLGEQIAISIATAIPFEEVIADIHLQKPEVIFINVETLGRNFYGAFPKDFKPLAANVSKLFVDEIEVILNLIEQAKMKAVIYQMDYSYSATIFKDALLYTAPSTPKKMAELIAIKALCDIAAKNYTIAKFKMRIPQVGLDAFIITHRPSDLLNASSFHTLELLESHTGTIKESTEWLGKLTKNEDYSKLPFNILTYQIFGDSLSLKGQSVKYRKMLNELADKCRWNPATTFIKVKYDLTKLQDKTFKDLCQKMAKVTLV